MSSENVGKSQRSPNVFDKAADFIKTPSILWGGHMVKIINKNSNSEQKAKGMLGITLIVSLASTAVLGQLAKGVAKVVESVDQSLSHKSKKTTKMSSTNGSNEEVIASKQRIKEKLDKIKEANGNESILISDLKADPEVWKDFEDWAKSKQLSEYPHFINKKADLFNMIYSKYQEKDMKEKCQEIYDCHFKDVEDAAASSEPLNISKNFKEEIDKLGNIEEWENKQLEAFIFILNQAESACNKELADNKVIKRYEKDLMPPENLNIEMS